MLASRLPGIMCPLEDTEQLEVASIRSLCGTLSQYGITDVPPFEAPHHTASTASLVGGGSGIAAPGAITRAHRGILFWTKHRSSAPGPCKRCANHWNPAMWLSPAPKEARITQLHSSWSWRQILAHADIITALASAAGVGKKIA